MVLLSGERKSLQGTKTSWNSTYKVKVKDDAGISPDGIEELVLWLDASNIDGRLNRSLNDDDAVAEWIDLSGGDHHARQSDTNRQPKLIENGINAKPAVKFNRTEGDYLKTVGFDNGQDLSIFMVFNSLNTDSERIYAHGDAKDLLSIFQNGSNGFHSRIWAASSNTGLVNAEHGSLTSDSVSYTHLTLPTILLV